MTNARNCEYCNKEFYSEVKYTKGNVQKYCSKKCCSNAGSWRFRYGLTMPELRDMLKKQDFKCAICEEKIHLDSTSKLNTARVDHDHSTGEVRGLLCNPCNVGIGHLKEDVTIFENAIKYIKKNKGK